MVSYDTKQTNLTKRSWRRGVVVITAAQFNSSKPEIRLCTGLNPARGVSEIRDGEDLRQWSRLERRLNAFRPSTLPQKKFIIISIIIIITIVIWFENKLACCQL